MTTCLLFCVFLCRPAISEELRTLILRMLDKNPDTRIMLSEIKVPCERTQARHWTLHISLFDICFLCVQIDLWVTQGGTDLLPLEEDHCTVVEVTEEDIQNSVKFVPSLSAVVRIPDHHHPCLKNEGTPTSSYEVYIHMSIIRLELWLQVKFGHKY